MMKCSRKNDEMRPMRHKMTGIMVYNHLKEVFTSLQKVRKHNENPV